VSAGRPGSAPAADGLSNLVEENEILDIVEPRRFRRSSGAEKTDSPGQLRGGYDNITLIIAQVDELVPRPRCQDDSTKTATSPPSAEARRP